MVQGVKKLNIEIRSHYNLKKTSAEIETWINYISE